MIFRYSLSNFIIFIVALALQVFVLNNVNVYNTGFPMIYPIVILLIPVLQPKWWVLIVAFLAGLSVDFLEDSGGLHAAATTFMAFIRMFVLNRLEPQAGYAKEDRPSLPRFGPRWFSLYCLLLLLFHHFAYYMLEEGSLFAIGTVILKVLISTILSFILILAINVFVIRR